MEIIIAILLAVIVSELYFLKNRTMKNNVVNAIKEVILIHSDGGESLGSFEEKINKRLGYLQGGHVTNAIGEPFDVEIVDIKLVSNANYYTAMIILKMGRRS